MLKNVMTHAQFQDFVQEQLKAHYLSKGYISTVLLCKDQLAKVWLTDLSELLPLVKNLYSPLGRPAKDPLSIFRSLLLMRFNHIRSIEQWVIQMHSFPIWAILSGFLPNEVPGVGTFYDFLSRLWPNKAPNYGLKVRKPKKKPKKGKRKGEKSPMRKPGIVQRLVNHFMQNPIQPQKYPHHPLQQIFKNCFVLPSARKGLLGDTQQLSVAGDGTSVRTGGSRYGKLQCDCRKHGIFNCSCPRKFSDPDASYGWDSYREQYYYGRSLYQFTAADSPYDLPIYLNLFYAERHDSACFVPALFEMMHLYPEFRFAECILDSAHDAMAIYSVLKHLDISAIIELNPRSIGQFSKQDNITFNKFGIPVCQADHIMAYNGYCKGRQRHKWRCPKTRKRWNLSCDRQCSDSSYGRVFYTYEEDNLRYFTRIPRSSPQWKARYKRRTSAERTMKRLKEDYQLEQQKRKSTRDWQFELLLIGSCLHVDAWLKHSELDMTTLIYQWSDAIAA